VTEVVIGKAVIRDAEILKTVSMVVLEWNLLYLMDVKGPLSKVRESMLLEDLFVLFVNRSKNEDFEK
jgi:hypothetical protein